MPIEQAPIFNIRDLALDVRLTAIVNNSKSDFTGKDVFSVDFFRKSIGFGITDIEIEVNTSLQPIITITFKDLYGNTVFGKATNNNPDLADPNSNQVNFSAIFNWPPPKFLFTFKGFLGKSATWMLNMKKSNVSYDSSDGSYNIKCEFVPNQWGFLSDLPFLYLLAVKSLKKKSGLPDSELSKVQTIFDLIKIGKQVEVKTKETTKEFDNILKQMTLLKSQRIYDAVNISKVVNYDEAITGQVGSQTIAPTNGTFNSITIVKPTGVGNTDIDTPEKIKSLAINSASLRKINTFFLLTAKVGNMAPKNITFRDMTLENNIIKIQGISNVDTEIAARLTLISNNITTIEDAIKKKTYDSSKNQLEKITIGEIFKQLAEDSGYIMGRILEAGYQGYNDPAFTGARDQFKGKLIGKNFPLWITDDDKKEEKPATQAVTGQDFGVEVHELKFVNDFIDSISEGIATELAEDKSAAENVGDSLIKKRINNIEALRPNPYQPFFQSIAENIMIRGGIVGYLTRSSDPNRPGDYDTKLGIDRATNAEDVITLADADLDNITDSTLSGLSDDDFRRLKKFCIFWDNFLTEDCKSLRKPSTAANDGGKLIEGDGLDPYMSFPGNPLPSTLMDYKVVIERPAQWDGQDFNATGLEYSTLRQVVQEVLRPRANSGSTSSSDTTNANFISADSLQSVKVVNNGVSYFKTPASIGIFTDVYTYVMFDGPDANKTQQIMSAESDAEIKNESEKQLDEEQPLGYVSIQKNTDDKGSELAVVTGMNERIDSGLLLNYSRLINPSSAFFSNPTSLTSGPVPPTNEGNINDYFIVPKSTKLGNPDNPLPNEIPAKNIAISIAYHSKGISKLVFGPFVFGENDSLVHRGYIKRMCVKLLEKLNGIEQKRNQVISDILGKSGEQKDLLYKQMHVLYQQWEVLIIKDSDSAEGQNTNSTSTGAIATEMADRYKGDEQHKNFSITQNVVAEASDNTFLYSYPLSFIQGNKEISVKDSIINIEPLYKPNGNTTILNIIQQICTKNNFIFIPMPGEPGAFDISDIFLVHTVDTPKVKNFFYVQFAPTPESRATLRNDDASPVATSDGIKSKINALEIKFGSPDNQVIKNISVDTQESKATAESIVNLQRLVDNENQNKTVTTDCSMLPVMEGRSYKASVDMLGNAQVFPMQFFYLDSIPLFNGLYQIMKVKHSIRPNDMTTTAEGIRMRIDFQTGEAGGIPPITLDTLANLPVTLSPADTTSPTAGDFANAVLDQGSGTQDGSTGTNAAGSTSQANTVSVSKGGSDIVPNSNVSTLGVVLPPNIRAVQNSIRLTQSTDENGATQIKDFKDANGNVVYKKDDIIRNINQFISDVLEPFAIFLKANYPKLYKNWYITSTTRSYVPIGGAKKSQHQLGQAVDSQIVGKAPGIETMQANLELLNAMLDFYKQNPIGYDQVLWETRASQNASWIHWSYKRNDNRIQLLRFSNDKTNQLAKVNTTGSYVLPGVTPQQIILSMS